MTKIYYLFALLLITSCESEQETYKYNQFRKQITPSGKYVIYDYSRYGSMAFSSDIAGTELFDIKDKFEEGKGLKINGAISEWISDDTLLVFNFKSNQDQPKDTFPVKVEYEKVGDFNIKTIYYGAANFGGRNIYEFDSVRTSNDLIYLRLVGNKKRKRTITFPLGATTIKTKGDTIVHIEVATRLSKNMDFVYKNKDGSMTTGLPGIGTTDYDLTPTKTILKKGLNPNKIFWEE